MLTFLATSGSVIGGQRWKLSLNIGRESGTWMPPAWAASGARLALPVDVEFQSADATQFREPLLGESKGTCRLRVTQPGKFIGPAGEEVVAATNGAWRATEAPGGYGETYLRFFLDFPDGAQRNDVTLPAGRVFFTTGVWARDDLERAEAEAERLKSLLERLDAEGAQADKEIASANLLQKAAAVRAAVNRNDQRVTLVAQYKAVASCLPGTDGTLEGPSGVRVAKKGGLCIKVKRLLGDQYHILGSFTMCPIEGDS